jgi:membrane associated rhomboid family serine protease
MQFKTSPPSPRESPFSLTPWVKGLIVANAIVYFLTITVFTGAWVTDLLAFYPTQVGVRWWTFFTYMFVHGGFLHLVFNMLMLYFFGPAVEERMRGPGFGLFYFTCGFGGAAFSYVVGLFTPVAPFVGASGAVLGVALAFAINWPNAPIYIFPLPMPIKVKWLVGFLVVTNLLMAGSGAESGIAYTAHLGGLLFGFIYITSEERVMRRAKEVMYQQRQVQRSTPTRLREKEKETVGSGKPHSTAQTHKQENRKSAVDRVLDKISQTGVKSLTPEERLLLEEESRQLRKH